MVNKHLWWCFNPIKRMKCSQQSKLWQGSLACLVAVLLGMGYHQHRFGSLQADPTRQPFDGLAAMRLLEGNMQLAQTRLPPLPPAKKKPQAAEKPPVGDPPAQQSVSVYSMWIDLSLQGYSQEEIEATLNVPPDALEKLKQRLRKQVMSNLNLRNAKKRLENSRDVDDVSTVLRWIRLEIRFAGMQNDAVLREMIRNHFGIALL